eukprot:s2236_g17.t1
MQLTRRSGRPMADAATADVLFGPVDLPGDTAVILIAFGASVDAFGSADGGDTTGISAEVFPTLETVSKTPPGPARRWGPVALGESTAIAGFAGGGELMDPAGLAGGVFGASTSMTLGDPTELFTGGGFTGGLLTGAEGAPPGAFPVAFPPLGIGFSFGGGVDGGGSGAGIGGGGGGGIDDDGGRQFGGG